VIEWLQRYHGLVGIVIQVLGLGFVSYQVAQASATFSRELRKDKLEEAFILHRHKQEMNRLLLDKSEAATALNMPPQQDILGFTLINDYQNLFLLRCNGLMSNAIWSEIEDVIYSQLKPGSSLNPFWAKNKAAYPATFISYIDHLAASSSGPSKGREASYCANSTGVNR